MFIGALSVSDGDGSHRSRSAFLGAYAEILEYLSAHNWESQEVHLCDALQYSLANNWCLIIRSGELTCDGLL